MDLNLDAFGEAERFINEFGTIRGRALANRLGLKGKGSALLATALSNYAWNTLTAQQCRKRGDIGIAESYEKIADRIYLEDIQPVCHCW